MHENMTRIGEIIRKSRDSRKMTQEALAKASETATRTIMDIENGKRFPTYEVLFKILHALDLSADQIFWPEKVDYTLEQDQLFRAIQSCDEHEQAVLTEVAWAYIRAIKKDNDVK